MVYWGRIKNGKVVLDKKAKLPDGLRVRVLPESVAADDPVYRLWELAADGGPKDLAAEHDHYIYGTPRRAKRRASRGARTGKWKSK